MKSFPDLIIGQEAICPDGMGRIIAYDNKFPQQWVQVNTYCGSRDCKWHYESVRLVNFESKPIVNIVEPHRN